MNYKHYFIFAEKWHQYDGVAVQEPPKSIWQNFTSYIRGTFKKKSLKRMETFAKCFCPEWFTTGAATESFQESLAKLDALVFGLRKMYFSHVKCFDSDKDFKQQVNFYINKLIPLT